MKGVCTPCVEAERGGPSLSALSIERERGPRSPRSPFRELRRRSRGVTMEVSHEASVRVSRGVHCMLSSCSGDRELPGGHARGPGARGASRLASHKGTVARSDPKKSPVLCMEHVCEVLAPEARAPPRTYLDFYSVHRFLLCELRAQCNASRQKLLLEPARFSILHRHAVVLFHFSNKGVHRDG